MLLTLISWAAQVPEVWGLLGKVQHALSSLAAAHQRPCCLCGMSRAFVALWRGDVASASPLNPNAPWLFGTMLAGVGAGTAYWIVRLLHRAPGAS